MKNKLTVEQFAKAFGCTVQQVNDLKAKNKAQLTEMYNEACRTGKRVNNHTSEQLRQLINGLQLPTTTQPTDTLRSFREGDILCYDDGKEGILAEVLEIQHKGLFLQFADTEAMTLVPFGDRAWADHLSLYERKTVVEGPAWERQQERDWARGDMLHDIER